MKTSITIITILFIIVGCEKRLDYWGINNKAPGLPISTYLNHWSIDDDFRYSIDDSVKVNKVFNMGYARRDDRPKGMRVRVNGLSNGFITYNNSVMDTNVYYPVTHDYGNFIYEAEFVSNERIEFTAIDEYDHESKTIINLFVFNNLLPEASFEINHLNNIDEREYEIDASKSFDRDKRFGGGLIAYEYAINIDTIVTDKDKKKYIFNMPGFYDISVRCQDNDSVWSDYLTIGHFKVE